MARLKVSKVVVHGIGNWIYCIQSTIRQTKRGNIIRKSIHQTLFVNEQTERRQKRWAGKETKSQKLLNKPKKRGMWFKMYERLLMVSDFFFLTICPRRPNTHSLCYISLKFCITVTLQCKIKTLQKFSRSPELKPAFRCYQTNIAQ